jgi:amino acid transporter
MDLRQDPSLHLSENVSLAAGEAKDPKNSMAKAIRRVWIRIVFFFCVTVFVMTLIMPSSDPNLRLGTGTAASSLFVLAFTRVGIRGLPHVINAGILSSAFSAASAHMYLGSRALWALSFNGRAPKIFQRTNKHGTPYFCVAVAFAFGLLAFTSAGASSASDVFNYFANMTAIVGLISWASIAFIYIRFHAATRTQGFDRSELMYRSYMQPFLGYYTLIFSCIVILFNTWTVFLKDNWSTADFICGYLPVPLFFIAYFGYKFIFKCKMIPLHLVDLHSNSEPDEYGPTGPAPKNVWERMWQAIV